MMKLSVVMEMMDKLSAPVKKMTKNQSHFTKQIKETQTKLKDKTGALAMITAHRKLGYETGTTGNKLKVAQEKLDKLNTRMKAAKSPTQALIVQQKKLRDQVTDLSKAQGSQTAKFQKSQRALKAAGVDVKKLTAEEKRLNRERSHSIKKLSTMEKRYASLKKIASGMSKMHGSIKLPNKDQLKAAGAGILGLGASVAGYFGMINSTAGEMNVLAKQADMLKMSLSDLQAIQSQAKLTNVDSDAVTEALLDFTEKLGELQSVGTGELADFLKETKSPLYKELKNAKDTDEAYTKLIARFSELKTVQEQAFFANSAFGGDGKKMMIMLRQGVEGLTKAKKEFNELGGGASDQDVKSAEEYKRSLQKLQEIFNSIKYAAITPVMEELTKHFNEFIKNFKDADWRKATLKNIKAVMKDIFTAFKALGAAFVFLIQYFPELLTGLVAFKTIMLTITAIMLANPLGIMIGAIALITTAVGYLLYKFDLLAPALKLLFNFMKRFGAGIVGIANTLLEFLFLIPRGIMKALSMIPKRLLPKGWGDSIKENQKDLEAFNSKFQDLNNKVINYALNGDPDEKIKDLQKKIQLTRSDSPLIDLGSENAANQTANSNIIKNPMMQSKSSVDVRILTDKPVEIARIKTDSGTDLQIDAGDLLGASF